MNALAPRTEINSNICFLSSSFTAIPTGFLLTVIFFFFFFFFFFFLLHWMGLVISFVVLVGPSNVQEINSNLPLLSQSFLLVFFY